MGTTKYDIRLDNGRMGKLCIKTWNNTLGMFIGCDTKKEYYEFAKGQNKCRKCDAIKKFNGKKQNPKQSQDRSKRRTARKKCTNETKLTSEEKIFIHDRFKNRCFCCNGTIDNVGIKKLSIDHNQPLYHGFPLSIENAVLICDDCNSSKGTLMAEEWYDKTQLKNLVKLGINLKPKRYAMPNDNELRLIIEGKLDWIVREYGDILEKEDW